MFDIATLSAFIAVLIGLFLIPGPAVLLTITRTVQSGRHAGIMTGLGIATGDFIHTLFAVAGLSAILMTSAFAFNMVKIAGAVYLFYMGIRAIMAKVSTAEMPTVSTVSAFKAYKQGILVEVLNPKTALFFLAFFPQFVNPENGAVIIQFIVLGIIFVVLSAMYTTILAIGIRPIGQLMKRVSGIGRWGEKVVGLIYIGLGLKIVFQSK